MKHPGATCLALALLLVGLPPVQSEESKLIPRDPQNLSLRNEVAHAISRGLEFLKTKQNPAGYWSAEEYPALTALALTSFMREPADAYREAGFVRNGYRFLESCVHADGGIYKKDELVNYNTSTAMMAFVAADDPSYDPILRKARAFTIGQQSTSKGKYGGGVGYGDDEPHSDMSNTVFALEALYATRRLKDQKESTNEKDLNWKAALAFVQRCQNLPEYNKDSRATGDPENKGGFVYEPDGSEAGEMKLENGQTALRSYGSMSYAGLLSYIYADLKRDDPRVQAVFDWLRSHYSVNENPGMGTQGLYYYLQTMAKGLTTYGVDTLTLADGTHVNWKTDLAKRMIDLQANDGSWANQNGRFWEKIRCLPPRMECSRWRCSTEPCNLARFEDQRRDWRDFVARARGPLRPPKGRP